MNYLAIIADARSEWADDSSELASAFADRFPEAEVEIDGEGVVQIDVQLPGVHGRTLAHVHPDGQALSVGVSPEAAVQIACWWRGRVPPGVLMFFTDEGYEGNAPIEPGASSEELLRRNEESV